MDSNLSDKCLTNITKLTTTRCENDGPENDKTRPWRTKGTNLALQFLRRCDNLWAEGPRGRLARADRKTKKETTEEQLVEGLPRHGPKSQRIHKFTETRRAHSAGPIKRKWYWYEELREQIQGKLH